MHVFLKSNVFCYIDRGKTKPMSRKVSIICTNASESAILFWHGNFWDFDNYLYISWQIFQKFRQIYFQKAMHPSVDRWRGGQGFEMEIFWILKNKFTSLDKHFINQEEPDFQGQCMVIGTLALLFLCFFVIYSFLMRVNVL